MSIEEEIHDLKQSYYKKYYFVKTGKVAESTEYKSRPTPVKEVRRGQTVTVSQVPQVVARELPAERTDENPIQIESPSPQEPVEVLPQPEPETSPDPEPEPSQDQSSLSIKYRTEYFNRIDLLEGSTVPPKNMLNILTFDHLVNHTDEFIKSIGADFYSPYYIYQMVEIEKIITNNINYYGFTNVGADLAIAIQQEYKAFDLASFFPFEVDNISELTLANFKYFFIIFYFWMFTNLNTKGSPLLPLNEEGVPKYTDLKVNIRDYLKFRGLFASSAPGIVPGNDNIEYFMKQTSGHQFFIDLYNFYNKVYKRTRPFEKIMSSYDNVGSSLFKKGSMVHFRKGSTKSCYGISLGRNLFLKRYYTDSHWEIMLGVRNFESNAEDFNLIINSVNPEYVNAEWNNSNFSTFLKWRRENIGGFSDALEKGMNPVLGYQGKYYAYHLCIAVITFDQSIYSNKNIENGSAIKNYSKNVYNSVDETMTDEYRSNVSKCVLPQIEFVDLGRIISTGEYDDQKYAPKASPTTASNYVENIKFQLRT